MNNANIKILLAQINPTVGAIDKNKEIIIDIIKEYDNDYDLIIFPELAICGYPPEDLLLHSEFIEHIEKAFIAIKRICTHSTVILGTVRKKDHKIYNSAALIQANQVKFYDKQALPNYGVFDEHRYFEPGDGELCFFEIKNHRFSLLICEDIWRADIRESFTNHAIDTLISINASPFDIHKYNNRLNILQSMASKGVHQLYINQVGAQDELLFDGQSLVLDKKGHIQALAPAFKTNLLSIHLSNDNVSGSICPAQSPIAQLYEGLTLALHDFAQKNNFKKVVIGLSGGVDSALTLALAADALGAKNVHALLMPSPFTSPISIEDAIEECRLLNINYHIIPIEPLFKSYQTTLAPMFDPNTLTLQNLQARIRGMLLMAYANQNQALLLSTSNKSETAVGYCTLYGDMCGGYSILKDVYKTQVYELSRYRNVLKMVIPQRVLERAPTAELAPNQTDQDDLPPYEILDKLLFFILEKKLSYQELQAEGYSSELIEKILNKIKYSEFKRFQASPGPKVTSIAFGKDWRYPITNGWNIKKINLLK